MIQNQGQFWQEHVIPNMEAQYPGCLMIFEKQDNFDISSHELLDWKLLMERFQRLTNIQISVNGINAIIAKRNLVEPDILKIGARIKSPSIVYFAGDFHSTFGMCFNFFCFAKINPYRSSSAVVKSKEFE